MALLKRLLIIFIICLLGNKTFSQITIGVKNSGINLELIRNVNRDSVFNGLHLCLLNNTLKDSKVNGITTSIISTTFGRMETHQTNGIAVELVNLSLHNTNGINISLLKSYYSEFKVSQEKGLNICLLNLSNTKSIGANFLLFNIGHLGNGGGPSLHGLSLSILNFKCGSSSGINISLINNFFSQKHGCQIGIINTSIFSESSFQIGLFNFNREANEENNVNVIQFGLLNYNGDSKLFKIMPILNF